MLFSKLEAVVHEESDIWTNLLHSFTKRDLLKLDPRLVVFVYPTH